MGVAAILVMWPRPFEQTLVPPSKGISIWNMSSIGPVVSEEMFENVDGQWMDGRRSHWYTIISPMSLRLRWAYKWQHYIILSHPSIFRSLRERFFDMKMWHFMVSKKNNPLFMWGWVRKSVPRDHLLSSLGKPRDANWWSSGRISLSHPYTHDGFL